MGKYAKSVFDGTKSGDFSLSPLTKKVNEKRVKCDDLDYCIVAAEYFENLDKENHIYNL